MADEECFLQEPDSVYVHEAIDFSIAGTATRLQKRVERRYE